MKIIINIVVLLFLATILACNEAGGEPGKKALKYVIINDSENIIDRIYLHTKYDEYKNDKNVIIVSPLKKGDTRKICPVEGQYITFRRELSKTDPDTKIYVTSSIPLNYKQGIITIKLGDSDFYVTTRDNPAISCECAVKDATPNCITELNECKNNPCQNGGSCQLTELSYVCNCPSNYEGDNCETKIDFCKENLCQNESKCIVESSGYSCECLDGYSGEFCGCEGVNCVRTSIFQFGETTLEDAKSLAMDSRGNIYIVGGVWASSGYDTYLTKLNSLGMLDWRKQWEGSIFEYGESIVIDKNDNIYIAGRIKSLSSGYNIFLNKIDIDGNIIWEKQWGTSKSDYLRKITVDSNGNIFLLGDTSGVFENNINRGDSDLFLLKVSSDSNLIWAKEWGSFDKEIGTSILLDSNDNIYITGKKESTSTVFITKFNTDGVESWSKQWVTSNIISKPLMIDSLNNPSILRYSNTSLFVTKLDNNGTELENRELITEMTTIYSTTIDTEKNLYTLGANDSFDIILTKYNDEGIKQFSREWGTIESDKAEDLIIDGDYLYITGYTEGILGNENYGNSDPFLIKTTKW
jgi:hypothetical protein